jgi:hypothetical protein
MPKTQEEIREASRIRQAKFYAKNKERVLEKKANKYEETKLKENKVVVRRPRTKKIESAPEPTPVVVSAPTPPPTQKPPPKVLHLLLKAPAPPPPKPPPKVLHLLLKAPAPPAPPPAPALTRKAKMKVIADTTPEPEKIPSPPASPKPARRSPRAKQVEPPKEVQVDPPKEKPVESKILDKVYEKVEKLILETGKPSAQQYADSLKTTIKVLNPKNYTDFVRMLTKEPEQSFYKLSTYEYSPGKLYKVNSLKTYVHGIIVFLTDIKTGITEEKFEVWDDEWKILKVRSNEVTEQKKLTEVVPTYESFYNKVLDFYDEYSPQVLLLKLYKRFPLRSDFYFKLVKSKKDVTDVEENYLIMDGQTATIIINPNKIQKGKIQTHVLDDEMTEYLKEYIKINKVQFGDYLVKNKNLSNTISIMKKKLGYHTGGAINFLRQVQTSDVHNDPNATKKDELKMSKRQNHSLQTAQKYVRNHEPIDDA